MSSDPYSVSRNHIYGVIASAGHSWLIVWSLDEERGLYYMLQHITLSWVLIQSQYFCSVMLGALDLSLPVQEIQKMLVGSLGQEDPLEEEMATHSSILAWKILWTEEPDGLVHGVTKSQTQLSDYVHMHVMMKAYLLGVLSWLGERKRQCK